MYMCFDVFLVFTNVSSSINLHPTYPYVIYIYCIYFNASIYNLSTNYCQPKTFHPLHKFEDLKSFPIDF